MIKLRRFAAVLVLLAPLAAGAGVVRHAFAQDCTDGPSAVCEGGDDQTGGDSGGACNGNGSSGENGGGGGCADPGPDEPDPTAAPPPRPRPLETTAPPQVITTTEPAPVTNTSVARAPRGGTATNQGGPAATDAQLAQWAKHFKTTPEEVRSWFAPYTSNDTIGGEGSGRALRAGEEYTISNNGAVKDGAAAAGFMDTHEGITVMINLHSTAVRLGTATTDDRGRFTATVKIPYSTKVGRHFVVATAPNLKNGTIAFVYPVNVGTAEPIFNGAVSQSTSSPRGSSPWVLVELVLGTAMIAGLVVFRVRRSAAART